MSVGGAVVFSEENFDVAARDVRIMGVPLTGFGDAVEGKPLTATVNFEATVPDDHENVDLRGKPATFAFVVREVKRLSVPDIDDQLLATLGFESEGELRDTIRTSLETRLDSVIQRGMRQQVAAYLLEKADLEIPGRLSERQTNRSLARRMIELYRQGVPETEIQRREDEMRAQAQQQSLKDLKLFFILEKIAEDRGIDVSEERLNAAIADMARESNRRFDRVRDELSKGDGMMLLYMQLRDEAVLDALIEDAVVTETEGPKKKSAERKSPEKKSPEKKTPATSAPRKQKASADTEKSKATAEKRSTRKSEQGGTRASASKKDAGKKSGAGKAARRKTSR
jgi:trigger factor